MRQTALAERAAAQPPAPRAPRKSQLHGACGFAVQASAEPQFFGGKSKKTLLRASEQAFPGAIDKPQFGIVAEGEDGQVNFLQDGAQESGGFQCAQALLPQRFAERIHFNHDFAHGVFAACAAASERKIFFAQGGQEIRKCLQGKDHAIANRESKTQPKGNDEECQCPDRSGRIISAPEEDQGDERTRNASSQREELDAALVSQLLHSSPCFCSRRYMALRLNPKALAAWLTFPSWRESVRWMR